MDTIDVNLKKKKRRKLFTNIAIASALSFAVVGVGVATIYNNDYQVTKAIEYDDEEYEITLSADELNNYHFDNLLSTISHLFPSFDDADNVADNFYFTFYFTDLEQSTESILCDSFDIDEYIPNEGFYFIYSLVDFNQSDYSINIGLYYAEDYHFAFYVSRSHGSDYTVEEYSISDFIIHSTADFYADIKSAIELDIQANQPYTNNTFLHDVIELLVGGIGVAASGIGAGLSTLVSNLAIQNGAMSPFMAIVLIFGAIALSLALSRWVVNLISSLGQRNR